MAQDKATTSAEVREDLVRTLELDLIGPNNDHELKEEVLPDPPSRWYLTGFLAPRQTRAETRSDATEGEEVEEAGTREGADDSATPERHPGTKRIVYPSSIGLSFFVAENAKELTVNVEWGDYEPEAGPGAEGRPTGSAWLRRPRQEMIRIDLGQPYSELTTLPLPGQRDIKISLICKRAPIPSQWSTFYPNGCKAVSLFLVNERPVPRDADRPDPYYMFQVNLRLACDVPFVPRWNLRDMDSPDGDQDKRIADLQFRDVAEFVVGHGTSGHANIDSNGTCSRIESTWFPNAEVERVSPNEAIEDTVFEMEELAQLSDAEAVIRSLTPLISQYRSWIERQALDGELGPRRQEVATHLIQEMRVAAGRIEAGVESLRAPHALKAFRLMNKAMAAAARQRESKNRGVRPDQVDPPKWRPFQLAFILLNLPAIVAPDHNDRNVVDLLFFPTGGGKTEAYLGLAGFTILIRRLQDPSINSSGLTVLMRYTLRLLTLDQLSRAAALICALELERRKDPELGEWPFEIGLWVGRSATPNRMGRRGDRDQNTAYHRTRRFQNNPQSKPSPIPIEECPWCGEKFSANSFRLQPPNEPENLWVRCLARDCTFSRERINLPILGVDDQIYRRLPCFLIATVDKFASLPWIGRVGSLFGKVDRFQSGVGFFGPSEPGIGTALTNQLPPPDLIIQDELHLISGPLGTMVGLYETALDELCCRRTDDGVVKPKIVASTATVRNAKAQVQALFGRGTVKVFPAPGPNRHDSFFALTKRATEEPPRLYVGVTAPGRSSRVILLRTYVSLMARAMKLYGENGGSKNLRNPADPYMTLLGYFTSLRELGGTRRIIEDEVSSRLSRYHERRRLHEETGRFQKRSIRESVELTSRVSTNKVAEAKRRLSLPYANDQYVDIGIATNMISVGLDITRLGLMVVFNQPKSAAEYIQTTSRVGRDPNRPGLVITVFGLARPRDRSHYERFEHFHRSFYREVEATSVTPFSPRALDRGFAGMLVGLARHSISTLTGPYGAQEIDSARGELDRLAQALVERVREHNDELPPEEKEEIAEKFRRLIADRLDLWSRLARQVREDSDQLQYQKEESRGTKLLHTFLDPELLQLDPRFQQFRANYSLRDVEPPVNLWLKKLNRQEVSTEDDDEF